MSDSHNQITPEGKKELRKHKWERIGIIASIVAVIGTLGFSVWDKIDYRQQRDMDRKQLEIDRKQFEMNIEQIKRNTEQIERTSYDKLYADVSNGLLNSTKLANAIDRIIEKGDDLSGMDLSEKWLPRLKLPENLNMYRIIFSNSYLPNSILKFANLQEANLVNTKLWGADLTNADLRNANLLGANLLGACLLKANLEGANLVGVDLKRANLVEANLRKTNLSKTNLSKTNLADANLMDANLRFVDLTEANLDGAKNLTIIQLSQVATLYKARLDPELMAQVKEKYPHLLEEPKPE